MFAMIAYASGHTVAATSFLAKLNDIILFPLMSLMIAVAMLFFFWGGYEFVANAESDEGRETGKRHMLFAIIGLLVMFSALALLKIAANTFGVPVNG